MPGPGDEVNSLRCRVSLKKLTDKGMEQSVEDQEPLGVTLGYNRSYNKRQVQRKWHPRGVTGSIQEVTFKPLLEVSGEGIQGRLDGTKVTAHIH